jgi:hypothetical protein
MTISPLASDREEKMTELPSRTIILRVGRKAWSSCTKVPKLGWIAKR